MLRPTLTLTFTAILFLTSLLTLSCGANTNNTSTPAPSQPLDASATNLPDPPTSPTPAPGIPDSAPLIAFLGDSISAGLHLAAEEAFPAQLQRLLAQQGHPFRLVNAGVSGDTSAGGLRRLSWILKQSPDLVVIQLGANDGLRGQPTAAIEENLFNIVTRIKASGAQALLLGMRVPTNLGTDYTEKFASLYTSVAKRTGTPFEPFFMKGVAGVDELNLPDGIHPTPAGHLQLAENLQPRLRKWLRANAAATSKQL